MPNFLNPWFAAAAAAVAIPSLLLLYFLKLRRKEVVVPSTLLWKKAIQDLQVNAPFQRLRKNLLLLLQMLLLVLLLLALARPVMNYSRGPGQLAVFVIDRSASMSARDQQDGKTRLEVAKRLAKEKVDALPKDGTAMVIASDDTAEIVRSFTNDKAVLRQSIDSIQQTDRLSELQRAFELAEAKSMSFNPEQRRPGAEGPKPQVWLFTDGRAADRDQLALRYADLTYEKIGSPTAGNVGIVALSAKRNYERPTDVQVFVRLANFGDQPATATVQMSVDGVVPPGGIKSGLTLLPERWDEKQREQAEKTQKLIHQDGTDFKLELTKAAVIKVELKDVPGDVLAADDVAQVVVPPPRTLNVLLVTKNGNYPLERFLESANLKNPGVVPPSFYEERMADPQKLASEYDVIMFDRYQPTRLPPAGNFVYFNVVPPAPPVETPAANGNAAANGATPSAVPARPAITAAMEGQGRASLDDQWVLDWDRSHPMLRGLNLRFYCKETLKLQVPVEAHTLVEGRKGPLIAFHRDGRHTHLVLGFDVIESNWPILPTFPVFLDNALQYLALGAEMDVRQSFQPGATPKVSRYNLLQAGANLKELKLIDPAGKPHAVPVPPAGDFVLPPLERVGVYSTEPPVPQFEKLAVNLLDENESNLLPLEQPPGGAGETLETAAKGKSRFELWWWIIACAALPLLLIEWWVYTRRMHM